MKMSVTFNSRRKARPVGGSTEDGEDSGSGQFVKRPVKSKQRSKISFGTAGTSMADGEEEEVAVVKPKRNLVQRVMENSASRNAWSHSHGYSDEGTNHAEETFQPAYSKEHIDELRNAHLAKPDSSDDALDSTGFSREVTIADKFKDMTKYKRSHEINLIPTEMEIQEKKARRAHLAKMSKYEIDPDASDDGNEHDDRPNSDEDEFLTQRDKILLRDSRTASKKEIDTRLLPDDQDLMEGFDDFTNENGRVPLDSNAQQAAETQRREKMREMIRDAIKEEKDDVDGSDQERRDLYEEVQTQKGVENSKISNRENQDDGGARTPPQITPIPSLNECVKKLRDQLLGIEASRKAKLQRLEELATEKKEAKQRELEIQRLLTETSEKYEKLSADLGHVKPLIPEGLSSNEMSGRGLESIAVNSDSMK